MVLRYCLSRGSIELPKSIYSTRVILPNTEVLSLWRKYWTWKAFKFFIYDSFTTRLKYMWVYFHIKPVSSPNTKYFKMSDQDSDQWSVFQNLKTDIFMINLIDTIQTFKNFSSNLPNGWSILPLTLFLVEHLDFSFLISCSLLVVGPSYKA